MYVKILKKQGVKINTRVCGPCYLARFVKKVTTSNRFTMRVFLPANSTQTCSCNIYAFFYCFRAFWVCLYIF